MGESEAKFVLRLTSVHVWKELYNRVRKCLGLGCWWLTSVPSTEATSAMSLDTAPGLQLPVQSSSTRSGQYFPDLCRSFSQVAASQMALGDHVYASVSGCEHGKSNFRCVVLHRQRRILSSWIFMSLYCTYNMFSRPFTCHIWRPGRISPGECSSFQGRQVLLSALKLKRFTIAAGRKFTRYISGSQCIILLQAGAKG